MSFEERLSQLQRPRQRRLDVDPAAHRQVFPKRNATQELHDNQGRLVFEPLDVKNTDRMRTREPRSEASFPLQTSLVLLPPRDFESDLTLECEVVGSIDATETSLSDLANHSVATEENFTGDQTGAELIGATFHPPHRFIVQP